MRWDRDQLSFYDLTGFLKYLSVKNLMVFQYSSQDAHEESKAVTKATAMKGNPFSCGYAAVACAGKK
ncbi:hypothetical protein KY290_001172 [Solanum tuberosum]|uniref:Uncharacterized protein n=1 Tax=Solanum tuberosum TaxID=4113 RepID=A0ABQ7WNF6_SOLTU|nr:hypothetical protein KY289_022166 [Solanum tuberosum]KAH0781574.1 hypothetical protein KY290_001172 [Solanum tuberosum]